MNVSTTNAPEFSEGAIINFMQVDAMKIQDSMVNVVTLIDNAFQLILSFGLGFIFAQYYYFIMVAAAMIISFFNFTCLQSGYNIYLSQSLNFNY